MKNININNANAVRCIFLIIPVIIAIYGIQSLYVYFTNTKPKVISIEKLMSDPPREKWVRVTGGKINLIDAAASEGGFRKKIEKVYVPIHPDVRKVSDISVLLLSTDPEVLKVAQKLNTLDETEDAELDGLKTAIENISVIVQKRPFEGLIQSGLSQNDRTIFRIRKILPNIVKEPIIIEEGKKPTIIEGLMILLFAFLGAIGILVAPISRRSTPPPLPPRPPQLPRNS